MALDIKELKQILIDTDLIPVKELDNAEKVAKKEKKTFVDVLIERDLISDSNLGQLVADTLNYEFVDLSKKNIPEQGLDIIPEIMARKQLIMIFDINKDGIDLAMNNPKDIQTARLIEKKSGQKVTPYYATEKDIKKALNKYSKGLSEEFKELIKQGVEQASKKKNAENESSIIKIVDAILNHAYESMASDIHIEPLDEDIVVRFRLDGILHDIATIPKKMLDAIVSRIKIMARLRTDEHRAAQDGKLVIKLEQEDLDVRVSIIPITDGEKIVMRLLSDKNRQFALEDLGLLPEDVEKTRKAIAHPHGMILVTGPTGSGKTTSLYAVLKILNQREVNISTIEDPVEYDMEGVNQIQVNPKTNLTFAAGLRSIVRQDPDIIMVGEIRDEETAGISVNAALTGHLVLSTLHTNDAATTLPRLLDMQIEPFLVASTVNIIIAQRLVRKICSQCVMSDICTSDRLDALKQQLDFNFAFGLDSKKTKELRFYKGAGCPACNGTGYKGRIGIFEILLMTDGIKKLIVSKADAGVIMKKAIEEGMTTMMQDGMKKVLQGSTTIEEVLRVTSQ